MDPFRRVIATAQEYLGNLTVSQKLLMASVGVIAAMGLFLAAQYTAKPDMIDLLATGDGATQQVSLETLRGAGIEAELKGGKLMVPAEYRAAAVAQLAQAGALPNDTTLLFANLLDHQGFYYSKQQNDQMYMIALQNELSRVIQGFRDIREARVLLDIPEPQGLGQSVRKPTASAMVTTKSGRALEQGEVDAIAQLIAGARAGLAIDNVRVIDGSSNRQRRPTSPDDVLPTTYLEHAAAVEDQLQRKLSELLGYIRGVSIAVTAQVDVTRVQQQSVKYLPSSEGSVALPKTTSSTSRNEGRATGAAEAGVRPNSQGDITSSSSGGNGSTFTEEQGQKDFEVGLGSETTTTQDPRGMPTLLAASVNVPRSFIVEQLKAAAGEGAAEPTEADINARWEIERVQIEDQIKPHLVTRGDSGSVEGKVVVSMIPMDLPPAPVADAKAGLFSGLASGGGPGGLLGGGLIEKGLLALLAFGAMGMMLMMVRKATKPVTLPTPEELAGIPPTLPTVSDLVGEADESEAAMTGIEVGDEEVRTQKLIEQVQDMVAQNPEGSASLLGRWISEDH